MGASDNCGGTKGGYGGGFDKLVAGVATFASGRPSLFTLHGGCEASSAGGGLRGGGGIAANGASGGSLVTNGVDDEADETPGSDCIVISGSICTGISDGAEVAGTGADAPCGESAEV